MQQKFTCGEITHLVVKIKVTCYYWLRLIADFVVFKGKRKKDASENAPQPKKQKHNWTTQLLKNTVHHEQYVNKQFNDRKKADLIEKCNYSKGDQIIMEIKL